MNEKYGEWGTLNEKHTNVMGVSTLGGGRKQAREEVGREQAGKGFLGRQCSLQMLHDCKGEWI